MAQLGSLFWQKKFWNSPKYAQVLVVACQLWQNLNIFIVTKLLKKKIGRKLKKLNMWQLKNSNCDITKMVRTHSQIVIKLKKFKLWQNWNTLIVTKPKLKLWQNKKSNWDKTEQLKLWQNSKNQIVKNKTSTAWIVTKPKLWDNSNCDKTQIESKLQLKLRQDSKTQIVPKLKHLNCDKTNNSSCEK